MPLETRTRGPRVLKNKNKALHALSTSLWACCLSERHYNSKIRSFMMAISHKLWWTVSEWKLCVIRRRLPSVMNVNAFATRARTITQYNNFYDEMLQSQWIKVSLRLRGVRHCIPEFRVSRRRALRLERAEIELLKLIEQKMWTKQKKNRRESINDSPISSIVMLSGSQHARQSKLTQNLHTHTHSDHKCEERQSSLMFFPTFLSDRVKRKIKWLNMLCFCCFAYGVLHTERFFNASAKKDGKVSGQWF